MDCTGSQSPFVRQYQSPIEDIAGGADALLSPDTQWALSDESWRRIEHVGLRALFTAPLVFLSPKAALSSIFVYGPLSKFRAWSVYGENPKSPLLHEHELMARGELTAADVVTARVGEYGAMLGPRLFSADIWNYTDNADSGVFRYPPSLIYKAGLLTVMGAASAGTAAPGKEQKPAPTLRERFATVLKGGGVSAVGLGIHNLLGHSGGEARNTLSTDAGSGSNVFLQNAMFRGISGGCAPLGHLLFDGTHWVGSRLLGVNEPQQREKDPLPLDQESEGLNPLYDEKVAARMRESDAKVRLGQLAWLTLKVGTIYVTYQLNPEQFMNFLVGAAMMNVPMELLASSDSDIKEQFAKAAGEKGLSRPSDAIENGLSEWSGGKANRFWILGNEALLTGAATALGANLINVATAAQDAVRLPLWLARKIFFTNDSDGAAPSPLNEAGRLAALVGLIGFTWYWRSAAAAAEVTT